MDDLFLSYDKSIAKDEFYVQSAYRRPGCGHGHGYEKGERRFSESTIKIGWSRIYDVVYHGIRPV